MKQSTYYRRTITIRPHHYDGFDTVRISARSNSYSLNAEDWRECDRSTPLPNWDAVALEQDDHTYHVEFRIPPPLSPRPMTLGRFPDLHTAINALDRFVDSGIVIEDDEEPAP